MHHSSHNNTLSNNAILSNGVGFSSGLYLGDDAQQNILSQNNITMTGTGQNMGLRLYNSHKNIVTKNNVLTTGNNAYAVNIDRVNDTIFTENNISTTGIGAYALYLITGTNNTFINDTITAKKASNALVWKANTTLVTPRLFNSTNVTYQSGATGILTLIKNIEGIQQEIKIGKGIFPTIILLSTPQRPLKETYQFLVIAVDDSGIQTVDYMMIPTNPDSSPYILSTWKPFISGTDDAWSATIDTTTQQDGNITLIINATDMTGNTTTKNTTFTIDNTPPKNVLYIEPTPLNNSTQHNTTILLQYTFLEDHADTCTLSIDATQKTTIPEDAVCTFPEQNISEGIHNYTGEINDTAGNTATTETRIINITTTEVTPSLPIIDTTNNTDTTNTGTGGSSGNGDQASGSGGTGGGTALHWEKNVSIRNNSTLQNTNNSILTKLTDDNNSKVKDTNNEQTQTIPPVTETPADTSTQKENNNSTNNTKKINTSTFTIFPGILWAFAVLIIIGIIGFFIFRMEKNMNNTKIEQQTTSPTTITQTTTQISNSEHQIKESIQSTELLQSQEILRSAIQKNTTQGYTYEEIENALLLAGWNAEEVKKIIEEEKEKTLVKK